LEAVDADYELAKGAAEMTAQAKEPRSLPSLVVPRYEARERLDLHIVRGQTLLDKHILSFGDLTKARGELREWSARNYELLTRMFESNTLAIAYGTSSGAVSMRPDMIGKIAEYHAEVRQSVAKLQAVRDVLDRIPVAER